MSLCLFRRALALGALAVLVLLPVPSRVAEAAEAQVQVHAPRMKQLQQHLLLQGAKRRFERARQATLEKRAARTRSAGAAAMTDVAKQTAARTAADSKAASTGRTGAAQKQAAARPGSAARAKRPREEGGGAQGRDAGPAGLPRLAEPFATRAILPNVLVNNPGGDVVPNSGQSETSVAAWGQYVMIGWNDGEGYNFLPGDMDAQGYGYSTNGGLAYIDGGMVPDLPGWDWSSDPVFTVNEKTGEFYFMAMVNDTVGLQNGIATVRATFSGNSLLWGTPHLIRTVSNFSAFIDKPWMTADSLTGNLYVSYTIFGARDTIDFQRSTNDGASWSNPIQLSSNQEAGLVQGSRPVVGPSGEVYVTWYSIGTTAPFQDFFRVRKSTTQGASFGPPVTAASIYSNFGSGAPGFNRGNGITFPSIAVDRTRGTTASGRVYLAWNESINFFDDDLGTTATVAETEPNDTPAGADLFVPGNTLHGTLSSASDFDVFQFAGTAGQTVIFYMDSLAASIEPAFRLFCSDGTTRLSFSDPGAGQSGLLVYTLPTTGTYYMRVAAFTGSGGYRVITGLNTPGTERARDHRDAFAAWSADGSSWSAPVRVSDSPAGYDDWLPEVAVTAFGKPFALWYDWRDSPDLCGGGSHVYLSRSDDFGGAWTPLGAVTDARTNWTSVGSNIAPNQGDYIALFANETGLYPAWSDGRLGNPDVYTVALPMATPTLASLAGVRAEPDRVTIEWHASGQGLVGVLYRRAEGTGWTALGQGLADGSGRFSFVDRAVVPGGRYAYRLGIHDGTAERFSAEVWVDVPSSAEFALEGVRPNPAAGPLLVTFALPAGGHASLALFDVSGRKVRELEVGSLGAGRHTVQLGDGAALGPGVYLVRLTRGDRTLTTRITLVR